MNIYGILLLVTAGLQPALGVELDVTSPGMELAI